MTTVYRNDSLKSDAVGAGYGTYKEMDTRVPPPARPVLNEISVNGVAIAENDILAEAQNHPAETPGEALLSAARALVVRQLLLQRAAHIGIEAEPQKDGSGRTETKTDANIRCLVESEVDVPSASEEECRRYYRSNRDRFRTGDLCEARHILLAASPEDQPGRDRARHLAESLIGRLRRQPSEFAELARQFSDCPSAADGGSLGQLTTGSTVEEFETALAAMKVGEISASPVESRYGFHIIALDRKNAGQLLPYEAVAEQIAAWLEASAWARGVSMYIEMLAGSADIKGISL